MGVCVSLCSVKGGWVYIAVPGLGGGVRLSPRSGEEGGYMDVKHFSHFRVGVCVFPSKAGEGSKD